MNNSKTINYFEVVKDKITYICIDNNLYQLNIETNEIDLANETSVLKQGFNYYNELVLTINKAIIIKSNSALINVIPDNIPENTVVQAKNLSSQSFSLDEDFLINKLNILAANKLELAYFKKFVLSNELKDLNIKYQELLYLLKNPYTKYFVVKINNVSVSKLNETMMQICYENKDKNAFDKYETYTYYLNIEDFFNIYEAFINPQLLAKIINPLEHIDEHVYLNALESMVVEKAVYQNETSIVYKTNDQLYQLNNK